MAEEERPRGGGKPRYSPSSSGSRPARPSRGAGEGARSSRDAGSGRRSDAERNSRASQRDGERRSFPKRDGDRKSHEKRDGERGLFAKRDGDRRPYEKRDGERKPFEKRDGERRSFPNRDGERKPYEKRDGERRSFPKRDGERKPYEKRDGERRGSGPRDDRRGSRPPQDDTRRRERGPEIPEDVTGRDLNGAARNELKTLSKENAEEVARHLVMAARLIDDDPALAHEHALAASRRAGRIGVVRETVAITAYATGDFSLALRELRTYRRISGKDDQIALMVDSERGVGRSDRALEVGRAVDRAALPTEVRVELAIAMSGARLDLGQTERALQELDIPELDPHRAFSWSPGLFAARAAVLEELGRHDDAAEWQRRAEVAAEAIGALDADREEIEVEEIEELELDIEPGDLADPDDAEIEDADQLDVAPDERPGTADTADIEGTAVADESAENAHAGDRAPGPEGE